MTFVNRPSADRLVTSSLLETSPATIGTPSRAWPLEAVGVRGADAEIAGAEHYSDLDTLISEEDRAFWCYMKPSERPSFTTQLLQDLTRMQAGIRQKFAHAAQAGTRPFDYFVLASRTAGVFNLGGDLVLFRTAIERGDREHLLRYAHACVDAGYANYAGYDNRVITIALIQGDALGGGLECALSCDMIIAEKSAKFGLPEVLFNLFPGMGAYSFLSRRIGPVRAEEMIMSGRVYTAEEMHALGVVQVLAEDGAGERETREYIARHRNRHNAHSALYQARRLVNPVTLGELRDVTELWVDAALRLTEQDLRKMGRLAAAQDRARDRRITASRTVLAAE
jgi:DSF synthase